MIRIKEKLGIMGTAPFYKLVRRVIFRMKTIFTIHLKICEMEGHLMYL